MGLIVFNGLSSKDFGIEVWQAPNYQIPEREYETIHIPGRNGDLVIDKESFKNVPRQYVISLFDRKKDFTTLSNKLAEWLHSTSGYARLEDSYEPDYYRMAIYQKNTEITNVFDRAGYATIEFNCKPQRFLISGDTPIRSTNGSISLVNPTNFKSSPILKAYGNVGGEIKIGDQTIELTAIDGNVVIDCETMEVYKEANDGNEKGIVNWNSYVRLNANEFPKFGPGSNRITFSSGITSLEVTPKWWTI